MRNERLMVQASVTQIVQRKSTLSIIVRYVWGCFTTRIKGVFNPTAMPVFYYLPATYSSQGSTRVHTFKLPLRFSCTSTKIGMHQHSSSLTSLCQSRVTLTLSWFFLQNYTKENCIQGDESQTMVSCIPQPHDLRHLIYSRRKVIE